MLMVLQSPLYAAINYSYSEESEKNCDADDRECHQKYQEQAKQCVEENCHHDRPEQSQCQQNCHEAAQGTGAYQYSLTAFCIQKKQRNSAIKTIENVSKILKN